MIQFTSEHSVGCFLVLGKGRETYAIDPSTVYSTFYMDPLGNILQHHWKERRKISKIAKFKSDAN